MKVKLISKAEKKFLKLPPHIQKKAYKQFAFLDTDFNHPSLHTKRMKGVDRWEARIDYQYRFTFYVQKDTITILSIGPHDEGLGAK